jgi:predicted GNAT family acetyltransferase
MNIEHDKEAQRFFLLNEGKEAYVLYRMLDNNTMEIFRTYVPPEYRNKGLAGKVVKASLDYAKENYLKVIPICSYTEYFIEKNKEYENLI